MRYSDTLETRLHLMEKKLVGGGQAFELPQAGWAGVTLIFP